MPNNRVVFVVLDGLRRDVGFEHLGYLNHLVEYGKASRLNGWAETPSNSRPMYEVLHTGVPTHKNGIMTNQHQQLSSVESIFSLLKAQGRTSAAAAYHWVSELYNRTPYNVLTDRIQLGSSGHIQNGIFYSQDDYPDDHLFADGHFLLTNYQPDFLLVHSMNIDNAGHQFGSDSKAYHDAANRADVILATYVPEWLAAGYQVIVTADHGMDHWGIHGGTSHAHRETPFFVISDKLKPGFFEATIPHLAVAPLICHLLAIEPSANMEGQPLLETLLGGINA